MSTISVASFLCLLYVLSVILNGYANRVLPCGGTTLTKVDHQGEAVSVCLLYECCDNLESVYVLVIIIV